jgi:hypothetical protein
VSNRQRPPTTLEVLRAWPLLIAAIVLIAGAVSLLVYAGLGALGMGVSVLVLGAVCLGAWLALLAASGYSGRE